MNPRDLIDLLNLGREFRLLPVPEDMDDLEMTASKMEDLARAVQEGNSLALYTGMKVASQHPRNPESIAKANLTPNEWRVYNHWRKTKDGQDHDGEERMKLPDINWDANVAPSAQWGAES